VARTLPPLNPLNVFEVAARVGSFTNAAEMLNVTPSAVSRQISTLESFLNVRLFNRSHDGNTLTEVGEEYHRAVAPAFRMIAQATEKTRLAYDTKPLNLRVSSTFAVLFLIPRLSKFRETYPNIRVRISTGFNPVDFAREDVDLSIQLGSGDWSDTECKLLFPNWSQPMCSEQIFQSGEIRTIEDLKRRRLLISQNRPETWNEWLAAAGETDFPLDQVEIVEFPNSLLAYQAAADGVGIVIGQIPLLARNIIGPTLVPLFDKPIPKGAYYASWRSGTGPSRKARQFLSWMEKELTYLVE